MSMKTSYWNDEIRDIRDLFEVIYGKSRGYIKLMCGKNRKGYFYNSETLSDAEKLKSALEAEKFSTENMYASLATFKTMKEATMKNLLTVNAVALDVDYTLMGDQRQVTLDEVLRELGLAIMDGFPAPSYIEHSRNMRLVYIFNEPYIIPKDKKKAKLCTEFLKRLVSVLSSTLNIHSGKIYFNSTPQRLTSFVRIPFSINRRNEGIYNYKEGRYEVMKTDRYFVDLLYIGYAEGGLPVFDTCGKPYLWDIEKLAEAVLPEKFEGYDEWKAKQKSGKKEKKAVYSREFAQKRMEELRELQDRGYDIGYRETLCFLYWITAMQSGLDEDRAKEAVIEFNSRFRHPFSEKKLLSVCKPVSYVDGRTGEKKEGWERKFTDATIRRMLGLENRESDLFLGKGIPYKVVYRNFYNRKKKEREEKGLTKRAQIERDAKKVIELRSLGTKWKDIADILDISERTAKRYGAMIA